MTPHQHFAAMTDRSIAMAEAERTGNIPDFWFHASILDMHRAAVSGQMIGGASTGPLKGNNEVIHDNVAMIPTAAMPKHETPFLIGNSDVISALEDLLARAKAGEIRTIAFAGEQIAEGEPDHFDGSAGLHDPIVAVGQMAALMVKLALGIARK